MWKSVWFSVCSCLLLSQGSKAQTVSDSCPVVMTPSSIVVQYGDGFTVDCNSTHKETEGIGWESNLKGTGLIDGHYVQLNIEEVNTWKLKSMCFMNINNGPQCQKNLPITIYKLPDKVSLLPKDPKQSMEEDKEYEFDCDVADVAPVKNVLVTWYKDGRSMEKGRLCSAECDATTPLSRSSNYILRAQKSDNGAKLMCEATFDFGPTGPSLPPIRSSPIELQVLYQPFFEGSREEFLEVSGKRKVTLNCSAQGNPAPQYQWEVPQAAQHKVESGPVFELMGPFPGTYNCTASNSQGSSVKHFVITDAPRDYTVMLAVVGVVAALGLLLLISGPFIVTSDGTFSLNKGGYSKGQASQPI